MGRYIWFTNRAGREIRSTAQVVNFAVHTNVDTDYTLTEVMRFSYHADYIRHSFKVVGAHRRIVDSKGHVVLKSAGQVLIDTRTGRILKRTSHIGGLIPQLSLAPDSLCSLLGGKAV